MRGPAKILKSLAVANPSSGTVGGCTYGQPTPGTATSIVSIREERLVRHSPKSMVSELITNIVRRSAPPSADNHGPGNSIRSLTLPVLVQTQQFIRHRRGQPDAVKRATVRHHALVDLRLYASLSFTPGISTQSSNESWNS
jgi:hypothetical protein